MIVPAFVGPSYTLLNPTADSEQAINWYPERLDWPGAKAQYVYNPAPGVTPFGTVTSATTVPALFALNSRLFTVASATFAEIDTAGNSTAIGTVTIDGNPPTFAGSGDLSSQIQVASGGNSYVYDLSAGTLTLATANINIAGYLNGTFYGLDTVNSILRASAVADAATWPADAVEQRSAAPDRWQSLLIVNGDVWVPGSETTDIYYDAGTDPFPLAWRTTVPIGIEAAYSMAVLDNAPTWLARNSRGAKMVVQASNGYGPPQRISTHAVETAINSYSTTSDAVAWSYQQLGHEFYILRFPAAGATWVYDASTQLWHERLWWDQTNGVWTAYRAACHAYAFGQHLVGDAMSGGIFTLDATVATDFDGTGIRRLRRWPHLTQEQKATFYHRLQIDLETGVGLLSGQGSDPQFMLRWSNDAGQTWGSERLGSIGAQGAYSTRALWYGLGRARDRVFELSASDPVPWRLSNAYLELTVGTN